jgi:hypothetical protein
MHWEYRVVKVSAQGGFLGGKFDEPSFEARLNELGSLGWEIVSSFVTHQGYGQSRNIVVIFKRGKG